MKSGKPLHMADVRASIERLFATGGLCRYPGGRASLTTTASRPNRSLLTKNSWFIGAVYGGPAISSPPQRRTTGERLALDLGQPYTDANCSRPWRNSGCWKRMACFCGEVHPFFDLGRPTDTSR